MLLRPRAAVSGAKWTASRGSAMGPGGPAPAVMTHVTGGEVRALGHSLPQRSALPANIPPVAETIPGSTTMGTDESLRCGDLRSAAKN